MSLLARGRAITMNILSGKKNSVARASHYSLLGAAAKSGLPTGQTFTVLGIETSCDDTGAAVVRSDGVILGESLASQHEIHEAYGGVVPGLAREAHERNIGAVVNAALHEAGFVISDIDAVAVTVGPGLEICLRVGSIFARKVAAEYKKPFVAVHHLEAHCLIARPILLTQGQSTGPSDLAYNCSASKQLSSRDFLQLEFPFLSLLVSGGHCQILLCHGVGEYTVLGGTLDDALGEAYDKAARMLGLRTAGAGGPAMEQLAADGDPKSVPLPIPMRKRKDCDFSYAGLKNAFRLAVEKAATSHRTDRKKAIDFDPTSEAGQMLPYAVKADLAASFQHVAICHLTDRLKRALSWCEEANFFPSGQNNKSLTLSAVAVVGGVASNTAVREALRKVCMARDPPLALIAPPTRFCTDNGVMVAWAAIEKLSLGISDDIDWKGKDVFPRWPVGAEFSQENCKTDLLAN